MNNENLTNYMNTLLDAHPFVKIITLFEKNKLIATAFAKEYALTGPLYNVMTEVQDQRWSKNQLIQWGPFWKINKEIQDERYISCMILTYNRDIAIRTVDAIIEQLKDSYKCPMRITRDSHPI